MLTCSALNKPWLYLFIFCYVTMMIFVQLGNPLLPIPSLAQYGWAFHHIPEILGFFFIGMWFGDFKIEPLFSSRRFNWFDTVPLLLLTTMSLTKIVSFPFTSVVIMIVTIPSFTGYLIKRLYTIKMEDSRL